MSRLEYPIVVEPLPIEDGGGFVATVPDLPGCMSDGETSSNCSVSQGLDPTYASGGPMVTVRVPTPAISGTGALGMGGGPWPLGRREAGQGEHQGLSPAPAMPLGLDGPVGARELLSEEAEMLP